MSENPRNTREFCLRILEEGDLAAKLAPPRTPTGALLPEAPSASPLAIAAPARDADLAARPETEPLPRPGELRDPAARARCLARFAHHELQAVELFAWALLRWPELPAALRRSWLGVLEDEQRHCGLYLERLTALGSAPGEHAVSDYFWRHVPAIEASGHGPSAFLAALGLTLEQANLDFSARYRDAFRAAGDDASADVCARVHEDEIGHVRLAGFWLRELDPQRRGDLACYEEAVPFPLSAARAKGRPFDRAAREKAGLSAELIDHVARARSTQETGRGKKSGSQ
ncbi:MAG: ferritin-like domain-containing protein [Myxococcales bacterium]|nr:ferritin-like domain-containing protein [Myxococcales bacterium]